MCALPLISQEHFLLLSFHNLHIHPRERLFSYWRRFSSSSLCSREWKTRKKGEQWEGVYIKHFSIFFLFFIFRMLLPSLLILSFVYTLHILANCFALIIHIECFFSHCSKQSIDFFFDIPSFLYLWLGHHVLRFEILAMFIHGVGHRNIDRGEIEAGGELAD